MSRLSVRVRTVRWGWRVAIAGLTSVVAVATLPGIAFAAFPLEVNVPMNTRDNGSWSFDLTVPRWNIVFMHPYSEGDEDLSVTKAGVQLSRTGSTVTSALGGNRMDFVALNNHSLPLGQYTADTWMYSGRPNYQIIPRTSSGIITPSPFSAPVQFSAQPSTTRGDLLGVIYDVRMPADRDIIISTDTPGGVFVVGDTFTTPIPPNPPTTVPIYAIPRRLAIASFNDNETCIRFQGNGQIFGLVLIFRDWITDESGPWRFFKVQSATRAQGASTGCRLTAWAS